MHKFTAQVLIENEFGEFLCVSRKNNHKQFGLPGGKQENDETSLETAVRETLEETGIDLSIHELRQVLVADCKGWMSYTFYVKLKKSECVIDHNEPHLVKWGTKEDLVNGPFGEYNTKLFLSL